MTAFADILSRNLGNMSVLELEPEDQLTDRDVASFSVEPDRDYHAQSKFYLSSHGLKKFRQSPALFIKDRRGLLEETDRKAYRFGRAAHCWICEGPGVFQKRFSIGGPINPKTGRSYGADTIKFREWETTQDIECLTPEQAQHIGWMGNSVWAHRDAKKLLERGWPELVVRTIYGSHNSQGRIDWISPRHGIVDLKTCENLTFFPNDIERFDYLPQLAYYRELVRIKTDKELPCYIIGAEKQEPYRAGVWQLSRQKLDEARAINEAAMARLTECIKLDSWPTGYEEMRIY